MPAVDKERTSIEIDENKSKKRKKEKNADEQMAIPERGEISKFLVQKKKKTGKSGNTALNFSLANLFLAFAFFFGSILIVGAP